MQIEDILVADKQLAKELLYDMKQHEAAIAEQERTRRPVRTDPAGLNPIPLQQGRQIQQAIAASSPRPGTALLIKKQPHRSSEALFLIEKRDVEIGNKVHPFALDKHDII